MLCCSLQSAPDKSIDSLFSRVFPVGFLCEVELGPFPVKLPAKVKLFQQFCPFAEPGLQTPLGFRHCQQAFSTRLVAEHLKCLLKLLKAAASVCAHLPHVKEVRSLTDLCLDPLSSPGLTCGKWQGLWVSSEALLQSQ